MLRELRRIRVLLAVLVAAAFVLLTVDVRTGRGSPLDGVRNAAAAVLGPAEAGVAAAVRPVTGAASSLTGRAGASARADRLARDNAALREELSLTRREAADTPAAKLLGLATTGRYRIVPARVVALGSGLGFSWVATIDAGSRDGLRPDLSVISAEGLVGRVKTVTRTTATVLLAADPASKVGVRLAGSGEIGIVNGQATGPLVLQLLDTNASVTTGQVVTTLGSPHDRPYAPGIPVGTVIKVFRGAGARTALVSPYVRFSAIDLVGVVVGAPTVKVRHATLPPKPDPVVTPGRH